MKTEFNYRKKSKIWTNQRKNYNREIFADRNNLFSKDFDMFFEMKEIQEKTYQNSPNK
jgi:hypothetical protein